MKSALLFLLVAAAWCSDAQTDSERGIEAPRGTFEKQENAGNREWARGGVPCHGRNRAARRRKQASASLGLIQSSRLSPQ